MEFQLLPKREEIIKYLKAVWHPVMEEERVPLIKAADRILSEDVCSQLTLPVVRASMCDGIAVKSSMFSGGYPDADSMEPGVDFERADTGDDFPDRYDAVIPVEHVILDKSGKITKWVRKVPVCKEMNVRAAGSTIYAGEQLLTQGTVIRAREMSLMAAGGVRAVPVYKKPVIAFLPTGTELVPAGTMIKRGQMIDSNSVLAEYTLKEYGCEPLMYPITKDDVKLLRERMKNALEKACLVLVNGGSSKGGEDFNVKILRDMGTQLYHGAATVPGRPVGIFLVKGKLAVVIPGPPMAAMNTLEWLVRPLIFHIYRKPLPERERVKGKLVKDIKGPDMFDMFISVNVMPDGSGGYLIDPVAGRGATIAQNFSANGYFYINAQTGTLKAGQTVEVCLFGSRSDIRCCV